jgi:hypothetical protein
MDLAGSLPYLMSVATGARMVLTTVFEPGEILRLIAQEGATILNGFDTHLAFR